MKTREVVALYEFLSFIPTVNVKFNAEDWKTLSNNRVKLEEVIVTLNEDRNKLIRKYSSDSDNDSVAHVDDDKREDFANEYLKMLEEVVDVKMDTISVSNLGDELESKKGIWEFMKFMVTK